MAIVGGSEISTGVDCSPPPQSKVVNRQPPSAPRAMRENISEPPRRAASLRDPGPLRPERFEYYRLSQPLNIDGVIRSERLPGSCRPYSPHCQDLTWAINNTRAGSKDENYERYLYSSIPRKRNASWRYEERRPRGNVDGAAFGQSAREARGTSPSEEAISSEREDARPVAARVSLEVTPLPLKAGKSETVQTTMNLTERQGANPVKMTICPRSEAVGEYHRRPTGICPHSNAPSAESCHDHHNKGQVSCMCDVGGQPSPPSLLPTNMEGLLRDNPENARSTTDKAITQPSQPQHSLTSRAVSPPADAVVTQESAKPANGASRDHAVERPLAHRRGSRTARRGGLLCRPLPLNRTESTSGKNVAREKRISAAEVVSVTSTQTENSDNRVLRPPPSSSSTVSKRCEWCNRPLCSSGGRCKHCSINLDPLKPGDDRAPADGARDASYVTIRPQSTTPDHTSDPPMPGPSLLGLQSNDQGYVTWGVSAQKREGTNPRKPLAKEDMMFVVNKRRKSSLNVREAAIANLRQGRRKRDRGVEKHPVRGMDGSANPVDSELFVHDSGPQGPSMFIPNERRAVLEVADEDKRESRPNETSAKKLATRLQDIENMDGELPDSEFDFLTEDSPDYSKSAEPPATVASETRLPAILGPRARTSSSVSALTTPPQTPSDSGSASFTMIGTEETDGFNEDDARAIERLKAMGVMFESDSQDEEEEIEGDDFQPLPPTRVDPLWQRPDRSRDLFDIDPSLDMTDPANRLAAARILPSSTRPSKKELMGKLLLYQCAERKKRFGNPHQEVRRYPEEALITTVVQLDIDFEAPGGPQVQTEKIAMTFGEFLGVPKKPVIESRQGQLVFCEKEQVQQVQQFAGRNIRSRRKAELVFPFVDRGN
ncbi:hypothetical protein PV04_03167 [Phialophora macrospora]|uniref:Uncharacterized protein n=1 Tax=Phialophora macrospora TaxID=1851006 RepID=A0A0D2GFH7_9EURO|nr:hypothetical protein PV04_03167 [Phialophora macrospora]